MSRDPICNCGHLKCDHIYEEGACRPGFVCPCKRFKSPEPSSIKLTVEFKPRPAKSFGGGFYQEWLSGKEGPFKFGLNSGAGLGNPVLSLWIQKEGESRQYFDADVRELVTTFLESRKV